MTDKSFNVGLNTVYTIVILNMGVISYVREKLNFKFRTRKNVNKS